MHVTVFSNCGGTPVKINGAACASLPQIFRELVPTVFQRLREKRGNQPWMVTLASTVYEGLSCTQQQYIYMHNVI